MGTRLPRLEVAILREISECLHLKLRDSRIGFVTISKVTLSPDLSYATVHVSTYGTPQEKNESLATLIRSASFIRSHLAKNLHTRTVPKLSFKLDENLDRAERIERILQQVDLGKETPPESANRPDQQ